MKNKEDHINEIIKENNYNTYLELGFQDGHNFNKIKCKNKTSVDINGKADFNEGDLAFFESNEDKFDCIFVDSKHEAEHVRKVISESLKVLTKDGCIILHDVYPPDEKSQLLPRQQKIFCGDVWRSAVGFIESYPDVRVETYRSDYGLTVLYPEGKKTRKYFEDTEMSYEYFKKNAVKLLNIID